MLAAVGKLDPQAEHARELMHAILTKEFGTLNAATARLGLPRAATYRHLNLDTSVVDKDKRTAEVPLSFYTDVWRRLRAYDSDRFRSAVGFWDEVESFAPEG